MGKHVKVKIDAVVMDVYIEAILIGEKKLSIIRHLPLALKLVPGAEKIFGPDWLKLNYQNRFLEMVDFKFKSLQTTLPSQIISLPEGSDYAALGTEYFSRMDPSLEGTALKVTAVVIKEGPVPKKVSAEEDAKRAVPHTPHKLNAKKMCIHCCRQLSKKREQEFCLEAFKEWKDSQLSPEKRRLLELSSARAMDNRLASEKERREVYGVS